MHITLDRQVDLGQCRIVVEGPAGPRLYGYVGLTPGAPIHCVVEHWPESVRAMVTIEVRRQLGLPAIRAATEGPAICVSKPQLRYLNTRVGCLETDSGKIFTGVIGRLEIDGLYHVVVQLAEWSGKDTAPGEFSLKDFLNPPAMQVARADVSQEDA